MPSSLLRTWFLRQANVRSRNTEKIGKIKEGLASGPDQAVDLLNVRYVIKSQKAEYS
jgi:hypothetical protein